MVLVDYKGIFLHVAILLASYCISLRNFVGEGIITWKLVIF